MHTNKKLSFDEFSRVGIDDWKQKAIQDLKGRSISDLHYVSSDGIKVDSYCSYENSNKEFKENQKDEDRIFNGQQCLRINQGTPNRRSFIKTSIFK